MDHSSNFINPSVQIYLLATYQCPKVYLLDVYISSHTRGEQNDNKKRTRIIVGHTGSISPDR